MKRESKSFNMKSQRNLVLELEPSPSLDPSKHQASPSVSQRSPTLPTVNGAGKFMKRNNSSRKDKVEFAEKPDKFLIIPDFNNEGKGNESRRSRVSARRDDTLTAKTNSKKVKILAEIFKPEKNLVYKAYQDCHDLYQCMYFDQYKNNWGAITTKIVMNSYKGDDNSNRNNWP